MYVYANTGSMRYVTFCVTVGVGSSNHLVGTKYVYWEHGWNIVKTSWYIIKTGQVFSK